MKRRVTIRGGRDTVTDFFQGGRAPIKDLEGQGHFQKGHFRLRRGLWLSKKAPRPSTKRHKGQKKKKIRAANSRGGGGGAGTPTQKKKKARRPLSSVSGHLDHGALSVARGASYYNFGFFFQSAPAPEPGLTLKILMYTNKKPLEATDRAPRSTL